jgi:hypothetical protein
MACGGRTADRWRRCGTLRKSRGSANRGKSIFDDGSVGSLLLLSGQPFHHFSITAIAFEWRLTVWSVG